MVWKLSSFFPNQLPWKARFSLLDGLRSFWTLLYSQNGGGKQPITKARYFIGENLDCCPETFRDEGWIQGSTMLHRIHWSAKHAYNSTSQQYIYINMLL